MVPHSRRDIPVCGGGSGFGKPDNFCLALADRLTAPISLIYNCPGSNQSAHGQLFRVMMR
jgi:hypothetical protein